MRLGVKKNELIPMNMDIIVANGTPLEVLGGIPIKLSLSPDGNGKVRVSHQVAYVAVGVNQFFICKAALCDLGLLPMVWPLKNLHEVNLPMQRTSSAEKDVGDTLATNDDDRRSQCLTKTRAPEPKGILPMEVPPLKLLVDPTVIPEAETYKIEDVKFEKVHKLVQVSTYFAEDSRTDLEEDVKYGVINRMHEDKELSHTITESGV